MAYFQKTRASRTFKGNRTRREYITQEKTTRGIVQNKTKGEFELSQTTNHSAENASNRNPAQCSGTALFLPGSSLYLRSSLVFNSAFVSFQASSSGLVRAVGFMWSSTVMSFPCFHKS